MSDSKNGLLGLGSHGPAVADVRARLAALPLDQLPDGPALLARDAGRRASFDPARFDAALERAVRAFQQHKGLIVDGVVGRRDLHRHRRRPLGPRRPDPPAHPRPPAARRGRRHAAGAAQHARASRPGGSTAGSGRRPSGPCAASSAPTGCPATARSVPTPCGPSTTCAGRCPAARPTCCASASWSAAPGTASPAARSCSTPATAAATPGPSPTAWSSPRWSWTSPAASRAA